MPIYRYAIAASIMLMSLTFLTGCGPRIDGTSEKNFKQSYEKIKSKLSKGDATNLENAIKIIGVHSMAERMDNNNQYRGMSISAIVMKKIDGKTYSGITSIANDYLKEEKTRQIGDLKQEINTLDSNTRQRKAKYDALKNKLSVIQGRLIKIDLLNGQPTLFCEFKNISKTDLDHFSFTILVQSISKKTIVFDPSHSYGGVKTLSHNDTLMQCVTIDKYYWDNAPEVPWNTFKYPVTNPQQYNLKVDAYADEVRIDDKDYDLSTVNWTLNDQGDYDKKHQELLKELKSAQESPDNLDDL